MEKPENVLWSSPERVFLFLRISCGHGIRPQGITRMGSLREFNGSPNVTKAHQLRLPVSPSLTFQLTVVQAQEHGDSSLFL